MSESKEVVQFPAAVLECPICMERFKDPRMLPACFHTLCYKCLKDLMETSQGGHFNCPVCRDSLQIPSDGAESFPKNFFMNNCLSVAAHSSDKTKRNPSGVKAAPEICCSNAEETGDCAAADKFCLDCGEYYCPACSKAHQRVKTSRDHTQIPLDGVTDKMLEEAAQKSAAPKCLRHKDEKLKLYCQTCQQTVCYLCSQISHKAHQFQDISDVDRELKAELEEAKAMVRSLADNTRQKLGKTEQSQQRFENSLMLARGTARNAFNKLQELLKQKANEVDKSLEGKGTMHRPKFEVKLEKLQLHLQTAESLSSYVEDLLCKGTAYNRLATLPYVRNQLRQVESLETSPGVPSLPCLAELVTEVIKDKVFKMDTSLDIDEASENFVLTTTLQPKAELMELQSRSFKKEVSIKMLMSSEVSREQFLKEAAILRVLKHRRILSLIGVCTTSEPLYIVTESLKCSLLTLYKEDQGKTIQLEQITKMAAQIAEGMAYLEEKGYVHTDLTANNILVGENNSVKVAGFTRTIRRGENVDAGITFPIKWTSPEACFDRKFSIKSDVWSFGIVLYEMVTYGQAPYPGMNFQTTLKEIQKGFRMPRPVTCPEALYDIMLSTWHVCPERRPTFEYLTHAFDDFDVATESPFNYIELFTCDVKSSDKQS